MSISRSDAKKYIARPLGGGDNPDALAIAEECLLRGFSDWQTEHDWEFLLRDNTLGFAVADCALTIAVTLVTAPTIAAFDGVNKGVTVTGVNIPANTTVSDYTRASDGTIDSIVLSNAPTGSTTAELAFSGYIPIIQGVSDYNLPPDFYKHYGVRFISNLKWPLTFIRPRDWNRVTLDQTVQTSSQYYTIFNPTSGLSQNRSTYRFRVYGVPPQSDLIKLDYYRRFSTSADPLDMDDVYLQKFLDYCRSLIVIVKRGLDNPDLLIADANRAFQSAKTDDQDVTEDEDICMKSQMEAFPVRSLWGNGQFWTSYDGSN